MRLVRLLAFALFLSLSACAKDGPLNVYMDMSTAAQMGDYDGFLRGFTAQSKQLVQSQLKLSEAYDLKRSNPVDLLVFQSVESIEEVEGDKNAVVLNVVSNNTRKRILMVKTEEEGWRIDVQKLAQFWEDEKKRK